MGVYYKVKAQVVNSLGNTDINSFISDLGEVLLPIATWNQATYPPNNTRITNDFNYFVQFVDDIITFGGLIRTTGANDIELKKYAPATASIDVGSGVPTSNKIVRLINPKTNVFANFGGGAGWLNGTSTTTIPAVGWINGTDPSDYEVANIVVYNSTNDRYDTISILKDYQNVVSISETVRNSTQSNNFKTFLQGMSPIEPSYDPYADAGDSDTGGGDGTFDGSSDPVPIPSLPTVGATDAGFITLFAPTSAQLHALASYCWSNLFDIDTFKKLFNDPMDCILGLSVVPVSVPTSGAREITVGNIVTTVQMNVASQQYIEVDCGSISFANKYFGSYLDYEPYTKMAIFLPYCGTHQISADDVMGKTIAVKYHIDILTGSCIAFVKCGDSVLYEFNGACASNIPVNSLNYSSTIENAIRIAVNIGTTVATAGASAPLSTATEGASALSTAQNIGRGISLAGSTAEGALSMKPSVSRSGAMGGGVGLLGNQTPYIIITRPRLCKPKNQDHFEGYPSFIYSKIEDLIGQGFTSFTDVIINEQFLTDEEENELEAILKGGVYL